MTVPHPKPLLLTQMLCPIVGLTLNENHTIPKRRVWSWALWDWATQPFASVITTFVFTVYVTSSLFLPEEIRALGAGDALYDRGLAELSSNLGLCHCCRRGSGRAACSRFWATL